MTSQNTTFNMARHAQTFYGISSLLFILPYDFLKDISWQFLSSAFYLFVCFFGEGVQLLLFFFLTAHRPCSPLASEGLNKSVLWIVFCQKKVPFDPSSCHCEITVCASRCPHESHLQATQHQSHTGSRVLWVFASTSFSPHKT